ncbi:MAG: hypothetical protein V2I37_07705 [Marinilabiliaceae bacterium]|jgi:hypothetical protein|nr:hypothetical protein [Marinilabiliaceae bacterium]
MNIYKNRTLAEEVMLALKGGTQPDPCGGEEELYRCTYYIPGLFEAQQGTLCATSCADAKTRFEQVYPTYEIESCFLDHG